MDTDRPEGEAPRSASEEFKRAADHIYQAADDAVEVVVPHELRHHLRSAARHLFQAGVAAIDGMERRSRRRSERRERRREERYGHGHASTGAPPETAGSHTPECL